MLGGGDKACTMQGSIQSYGKDYKASKAIYVGVANPSQPGPAHAVVAPQFPPPFAACIPPVPDDMLLSSEGSVSGLLCSVQLPVNSASPTQSAWCPVSNLLAVAFTPEPGTTIARILIIEPSNLEDVTRLEVTMAGKM